MLVDHDILIDAGTGVADLTLSELELIDHVFVTHSHLDHVAALPLIVDTVGPMRKKPLTVHCCRATMGILRDHLFNWRMWPDFSEIPNRDQPYLAWDTLEVGETAVLRERRFTALPANHVVPAVGYWLDSGSASLVFTGDTTTNDALWVEVNKIENLRYLIIETAFPNTERELAVFVTHLKPGAGTQTMAEVEEDLAQFNPRMLANGQVFRF